MDIDAIIIKSPDSILKKIAEKVKENNNKYVNQKNHSLPRC